MEEVKNMKVVQVDFKCPECESGYLRPNGRRLLSSPPKYPHFCNNVNCSYNDTFTKTYPHIDYVPAIETLI